MEKMDYFDLNLTLNLNQIFLKFILINNLKMNVLNLESYIMTFSIVL